MKIRKARLAREKSGHVTISALAKELGISRDTFYRKGYGAWYKAHYRKHVHQEAVSDEEMESGEELIKQGIRITNSDQNIEDSRILPSNWPEVAQGHVPVVEAYERGEKDFDCAVVVDYVKGLPPEERLSLEKLLTEERGYDDDRLWNLGFPRPKKNKPTE